MWGPKKSSDRSGLLSHFTDEVTETWSKVKFGQSCFLDLFDFRAMLPSVAGPNLSLNSGFYSVVIGSH